MSNFPDVPVSCTSSGLVVLLDSVLPMEDYDHAVEKLHRLGAKSLFTGKVCPGCLLPKLVAGPIAGPPLTCEYRPLRGPLFVPR